MHRQKCLCGSFRIQVANCENLAEPKLRKSILRSQAMSRWQTVTVDPSTDPESALPPWGLGYISVWPWCWHWHHSLTDLSAVTQCPELQVQGPGFWLWTLRYLITQIQPLLTFCPASPRPGRRQNYLCLRQAFDFGPVLQQILKWLCNSAPAPLRYLLGVVQPAQRFTRRHAPLSFRR